MPEKTEPTPVAQEKPPLDFVKVDALRKHMLLTVQNMADIIGSSRITYYSWLKGKYPRKRKEAEIRAVLKRLFVCIMKKGWPSPTVLMADQEDRYSMLLELLSVIKQEELEASKQ